MFTSVMNLPATHAILSLKRLPYYAFYYEGKPQSIHTSREDAVRAAINHSLKYN